jgi:spoIIIJ-associated protein
MARVIEMEGNTVDEAVEAALNELGVDRDSVEVEVVEEGSRSFFGRLSQAKARVRVVLKEESQKDVIDLIKNIMSNLGISGDIRVQENESSIKINVSGPDIGLLIGKRGETLEALQTIANVVMRKGGANKRIEIDVESYRERRAESLRKEARQAAERAVRLGRPVLLKPMNSYERRMVHVALQDNNQVVTLSEGEEPSRKVKISPK